MIGPAYLDPALGTPTDSVRPASGHAAPTNGKARGYAAGTAHPRTRRPRGAEVLGDVLAQGPPDAEPGEHRGIRESGDDAGGSDQA